MIITLGHTKGGVGKSTLALNIAIERLSAGVDTLLIDGDPRQTSISKAVDIRSQAGNTPELPCLALDDTQDLRHQVELQKSNYQDIVIDVGGKDSIPLRSALAITDVLLLPVAPESVEIWALDDILEIVTEARAFRHFRVMAFVNRAKPAGRDNEHTKSIIREYEDIHLIPNTVGDRNVFSSAFGRGQSVSEFRPLNRKAVNEISALMQSVFA